MIGFIPGHKSFPTTNWAAQKIVVDHNYRGQFFVSVFDAIPANFFFRVWVDEIIAALTDGETIVKSFLKVFLLFSIISFNAFCGQKLDIKFAEAQSHHEAEWADHEAAIKQSAETGLPGGVVGEEVEQTENAVVHGGSFSRFEILLFLCGALFYVWVFCRGICLWLYYRTLCIEQDVRLERW